MEEEDGRTGRGTKKLVRVRARADFGLRALTPVAVLAVAVVAVVFEVVVDDERSEAASWSRLRKEGRELCVCLVSSAWSVCLTTPRSEGVKRKSSVERLERPSARRCESESELDEAPGALLRA